MLRSRVSKTINASIPVYRADRSLYGHVSEERLARLQSAGLVARVVRHRKGYINRVILLGQPGEPNPVPTGAYLGTRYVLKQQLDSGSQCWRFKPVDRKDEDGIVFDGRAVFLQVVQDCLAP